MPSAILMGSKPGSVVALEVLRERGWTIPAVVVTPRASHPWIAGPSLAEAARGLGLPVMAQGDIPGDTRADVVISYMYRRRVRRRTLERAYRAAVNFHAGPLPEFGGWAFYNVAILEQVPEYGCTCHHMDDGFDTGPLLAVRRFPIDAKRETAVSLEARTQEVMIALFVDFCRMVENGGALPREPQDPRRMRYLDRKRFEELKRIPAGADREAVDRYARAFWYPPYECAYVELDGARAEIVPECAKEELARGAHRNDLDRLRMAARLAMREGG